MVCQPLWSSGDDAYIEHARSVLPNVEGVTTKWAVSFTSARTLMPQAWRRKPWARAWRMPCRDWVILNAQRLPENSVLEVVCLQRKAAELLDYLPNVERTDASHD